MEDHHGYILELKVLFRYSKGKSELIVLLVQFANLTEVKKNCNVDKSW